MGKKAMMIVSFGTSFDEALPAIVNIEEHCKKAFADYDFYRAFTSGMIIRKLKRTKDVTVYNPGEVIELLADQNYEEVICQPTHIINGSEYDKMQRMLAPYKDRIPTIKVGAPLLSREEDYRKACRIMMEEIGPLNDDEAFVLMGHGSEHPSNSAYSQFEAVLRDMGYDNVFVGTVEGFPDLSNVMRRMKALPIKKIYLAPLMIVAGDHARNDLSGPDEDSWDFILRNAGYETEVRLKGMGEIDKVAEMFVEHLEEARPI